MNKQELIARNQGVKLYDLNDRDDMHRMNMNLNYCIKNNKEPSFKLIAPFGHPLKYKADFYYFESENTPITEQILEEMGFEYIHFRVFLKKISNVIIKIIFEADANIITINNIEKNLNANQLHQLIELLK
jgi:hypothetical protein